VAARIFAPAKWSGAGAPEIESIAYTAAQTFKKGEVVQLDGTAGTVVVCTANPQAVYGIALEDAASKPGNSMGHSGKVKQVTGGNVGEVSVARANPSTIFSGLGTSAAAITQIGTDYGLAVASNVWTINNAEESTVSVIIVDVNVTENIQFFKFLTAVLELP